MEAGAINLRRRALLRGELTAPAPLRPPWAIGEARFTQACTRCDACVEACPERLLVRGSAGFPEAAFTRRACTFCGDCLRACPEGALSEPAPTAANAWRHTVAFGSGCLSMSGVVCRVCGEVCGSRAIGFRLQTGGRAQPGLEPDRCSGCGACIAACPAGAVTVHHDSAEDAS